MRLRTTTRRGFTLLEVLLASLIAVFLLGGLYVAFDVTLRQTQEAKDSVYVSHLTRGAFNRMALDLAASCTPLPPKSGGNPSSGSSDSSGTTTDTSASTTTDGTSTDGTTTSGASATTTSTGFIPFQAGVLGTDTRLTVFVSKVPFALGDPNTFSQIANGTTDGSTAGSDLVRVTYWMANGGTGPLCRQERPWVTASGVGDTADPDTSDEASDVIVDEVTTVLFEYFDGTTGEWTTTWDGSTAGADGSTPIGPPRAIRVTLTLEVPASKPGQPPLTRTVTQVIPVRTAPGMFVPSQVDTSTDTTGTTTGGTTTTGGGM